MNKSALALGVFALITLPPRAYGVPPDEIAAQAPKDDQSSKTSQATDAGQPVGKGSDSKFDDYDGKTHVEPVKPVSKGPEGSCAADKKGSIRERCAEPNPPEWCKHPIPTPTKKEKSDGGGG